ncbi:glucose-6-phosphate dehydrogenase [Paenibacillus sp. FSL K6-1230]|uniref:glucose-6-phosphate dehydrogenase n=1 Tax=Paenibacillus sp. FSL K6-1230 TaxID=2921603 RepID=UPI0030F77F67
MDSMTFVLFGATGDLASRKIYPALFNLYLDQKLPDTMSLIGVGLESLSQVEFQARIEEALLTFSRHSEKDLSLKKRFSNQFQYVQLDVNESEGYKKILRIAQKKEQELGIKENRMFYLSVAPKFFNVIAYNIMESGLGETTGWKRLIIEKPFGHDLESAKELNSELNKAFNEEEIFIIDHYLGKPMVQNLESLGFANPMLQSLWNNQFVANVQITASETVGVEQRAAYYDKVGAIRDMVQNHLLQLVVMTAMHLPKQIRAKEIRQVKKKVMQSLRPLHKDSVGIHVVRGQYGPGEINGTPVPGYLEEPNIDISSKNDTFVAARLWIDDSIWDGVPFYIRTGKRMSEKSTKIVIEFKNTVNSLSNEKQDVTPNLFMISVSPSEGVSMQINRKNSITGKLEPIKVNFTDTNNNIPESYELLLLDALRGDSTFFAHWDEVELSWRWIQPILETFDQNGLPLHEYSAGTMGPEAAHQLLESDGFKWW